MLGKETPFSQYLCVWSLKLFLERQKHDSSSYGSTAGVSGNDEFSAVGTPVVSADAFAWEDSLKETTCGFCEGGSTFS